MVAVDLEYIAAGGNRHPSAADWTPGLLAFGAGNNVAVWSPGVQQQQHNNDDNNTNNIDNTATHDDKKGYDRGISDLLAGHTGAVNAVKIYRAAAGGHASVILSGSADHSIRVWERSRSDAGFTQRFSLGEHSGSINVIDVLPQCKLFVSGAADGTVRVWTFDDGDDDVGIARLVQTIELKPRCLPLTCKLTVLDDGAIVLAVAGTNALIRLYVRAAGASDFELQATLSGHEGWIRSLDFARDGSSKHGDLLLASASQDKYIRLWRFHRGDGERTADVTDAAAAHVKKSLSNRSQEVGSNDAKYTVTFEALLIGHEDWIYTARWSPAENKGHPPLLLSASADNSLSIWRADESSGLWICQTRLGEISAQKGSTTATGSTGGFWIGLWQPDGNAVVSLGRTGSWRRWGFNPTNEIWEQCVAISGHTDDVRDVAWAPDGSYLISTGADQTTRVIAQRRHDGFQSWHEFARPQIHGYDLNCLAALSPNQFVSGADEKLLRVFDKPKAIDDLMSRLCGLESTVDGELADAANIPVLGLSNKAVATVADEEEVNGLQNGVHEEQDNAESAAPLHKSTLQLNHPPFEEHLARHTLWPEHEKLYGHGYEICAVAASHDGSLIATACRASSIDHAVIRLYETRQWREVKPPLTAHSLTVTSLAFSPDDKYLLSVGRDRQWAVYERQDGDENTYIRFATNPKGHSRMILDCSWAPQGISTVFATAGRDKSVKLWRMNAEGNSFDCAMTISADTPVTAVAFNPDAHQSKVRLAYGTEEGVINIADVDLDNMTVLETIPVPAGIRPSKAVNVLRWRPGASSWAEPAANDDQRLTTGQLAVGSEDSSLRIYNVT